MKMNSSEVVCKDLGLQPDKIGAKMCLVHISNKEIFFIPVDWFIIA